MEGAMKRIITVSMVIACFAVLQLWADTTVTNYMSLDWPTNAAVATNPYGNWVYAYGTNGNRQLPYILFDQYKGVGFWDGWVTNCLDIGATNMNQCIWYLDQGGKLPAAGLDEYSFNGETGEYNPNDTCVQLFTGTNGQNTSVGWTAPTEGTVDKIYIRWKTFSYWFSPWAVQTNAANVYLDHVRGNTILNTLHIFTNNYTHDYWGPVSTIQVTTPFDVEAGDIIYISFIQRNIKAFNTYWIFGRRWDSGNNDSYIVFTSKFTPPLAGGGWPKNGQNMYNSGQSPYNTPAGVTAPTVRVTYTPHWVAPLNPGALADQAGRTVLTEDRVIVASADMTLKSFNRLDGSLLWSVPLGTHGWQWMQSSTPLVSDQGIIYVGGANMLYAFDMDGSQLWSQVVATGVDSWVGGSPAISPDGSVVYCAGCCDNDGSKLIAADTLTGATNWVYSLQGSSWAAPAVGQDGTIYIGGGVSWSPDPVTTYLIQAIHPDGTLKWAASNATEYIMMQNVSLSPDGSMVLFNDFNDNGSNQRRVTALSAATGALLWQKEVSNGGEFFPSMAVDDSGDIYCNGEDGFRKLSGADGAYLWQNTSISRGFTPALSADGTVWTKPDNEENLIGLDMQTGARIAQIVLGPESLGWTTPAIGDEGYVYISTRSNLYCLAPVVETAIIDWCNLQWPPTLSMVYAGAPSDKVYGQVYIEGATPEPGPTPGLQAWLGYGAPTENPDEASWNWITADINPSYSGNNDEYYTNFYFSLSETGTYVYCYRYQYGGQAYMYGQKDGPHTLETYDPDQSGQMTVVVPEAGTILTALVMALLALRKRR